MLVFLCEGVARPVLVVPWIVIQELDSLKVCQFLLHVLSLLYMFLSGVFSWRNHVFKNQCFTQKVGDTGCMYRSIFRKLQFGPCFSGTCGQCANKFFHFSMQYTLWTNKYCYHLDTVCSSLDNELLRIPGMLKFCL